MSRENDYVWYQEIESGQWVQISRRTFDAINYAIRNAMIKNNFDKAKKIKGTIRLFSTMADHEAGHEDFKQLWQDSNKEL